MVLIIQSKHCEEKQFFFFLGYALSVRFCTITFFNQFKQPKLDQQCELVCIACILDAIEKDYVKIM